MTIQQLMNALAAVPVEHRGATVWQSVIDGRCETMHLALYKPGRLGTDEGTVLILRPDLLTDLCPTPDLLIVPGKVVE